VTNNQPGGDAIRRLRTWAPGLVRAPRVFSQWCWPQRDDCIRHDSSDRISLSCPRGDRRRLV